MNCLDTYALVEIRRGNPRFQRFLTDPFFIAETTLAEFYGVLYREDGEGQAMEWVQKLVPFTQAPGVSVLLSAVRFRSDHRKDHISFFDAVGYQAALANRARFVTGDQAFEKLPGVEFVK